MIQVKLQVNANLYINKIIKKVDAGSVWNINQITMMILWSVLAHVQAGGPEHIFIA